MKPFIKRGRVDIGLERRARLPQRIGRAIELAGAIVAAADHGAHAAVGSGHHHRSLVDVILVAELAQVVFHRFIGRLLQIRYRWPCAR